MGRSTLWVISSSEKANEGCLLMQVNFHCVAKCMKELESQFELCSEYLCVCSEFSAMGGVMCMRLVMCVTLVIACCINCLRGKFVLDVTTISFLHLTP